VLGTQIENKFQTERRRKRRRRRRRCICMISSLIIAHDTSRLHKKVPDELASQVLLNLCLNKPCCSGYDANERL
jgi:hypothetical protein